MRDGHIHSPYCPHGSSDRFEQYIKKAIEVGVMVMTFTEHFPLPKNFKDPSPENDSAMSEDHLLVYFNELKELKEKYKDIAKSDEDVLSLALFENVATEFLKKKYNENEVEEFELYI